MELTDLSPAGDTAVVVRLGTAIDEATRQRVLRLSRRLDGASAEGLIEIVPGYTTLTVYYDPLLMLRKQAWRVESEHRRSPYRMAVALIRELAGKSRDVDAAAEPAGREMDIPVCYGGELGPDLDEVAAHAGLLPDEVIAAHSSARYIVHMLGFAPGFPYLGGMPDAIAAPRRATPRLVIPAGSVGIGGRQTGVYPLATPGGWQLIGRTPERLFRPDRDPPTLLQAGDRVRFVPITREQFDRWEAAER